MKEKQTFKGTAMSARAYFSNRISNGLRHLRDVSWRAKSTSADRGESGAALVEFTILMPLFFLILFGIVQFGAMLWLQNNMTNAAREGARRSAVQGGNMTAAAQAACNWLSGASRTFTITATDRCPGTQDVSVSVSLSKADASLLNTFFTFAGGTLSATTWGGSIGASVTMRKELSCPVTALPTANCNCDTSGVTPTTCP